MVHLQSTKSKRILTIVILFIRLWSTQSVSAQTEKISECLAIIPLTETTYIHSCSHNNGIIYINNGEAIIVSTPDSDEETQNLIDWVQRKANIVGYIIDRWHPDAMEGLDIVHKNNIPSYSSNQTKKIAGQKSLPEPKFGFKKKLKLPVGNQKIRCHYLGEAHTSDGIVVWIPDENILFGGNEIRNNNGWVGNIADANLRQWSKTARRIKKKYGNATFVVPGHGKHGGTELIDYTIGLYDFPKNAVSECIPYRNATQSEFLDRFNFVFTKKEKLEKTQLYHNAKVTFKKTERQFEVTSDSISYTPSKKSLYIPYGCISIKEKNRTEQYAFTKLYATLREDTVELTVVIKNVSKN